MKHHIKIQLLMCSLFIALLSAVPFSSYAESSGLNEQEFARVCEDNHAVQTRSLHPPLKNPAADTFNYEFHYREILLSPDGKGFIDKQVSEPCRRTDPHGYGRRLRDIL